MKKNEKKNSRDGITLTKTNKTGNVRTGVLISP